jgi:hypothetical protein
MSIEIVSKNNSEQHRYIPIVEAKIPQQPKAIANNERIIPSKTLVINELNVTITQNFDEDVDFRIDTKPGILSDNKTIPVLDIIAKEDIEFDENLTLAKLESIVRRCGILDTYKEYFTNDPDIVINQYTLTIRKRYKYFNEFREGIMIAGDIVT